MNGNGRRPQLIEPAALQLNGVVQRPEHEAPPTAGLTGTNQVHATASSLCSTYYYLAMDDALWLPLSDRSFRLRRL